MQFTRDEDMEAEINLTEYASGPLVRSDALTGWPRDELEAYKTKGVNLEKKYEAPAFEVVASIFRQLTGKKPVVPNGTFQR
jgi:hypothetical protein